jgi:hypothetical protein
VNQERPPSDAFVKIPRGGPIHQYVLETFAATGHSPTVVQIRERFSLRTLGEADAMIAALQRAGSIHRSEGHGAITHAYPFSNEPTAHHVLLRGGPEVFAMCAIDALGMPFMLRKDADIVSTCAGCRAEVRVAVRDGDVKSYAPIETLVWVGQMSKGCVAATDLCPDLNFFCSSACIDAWTSAHPGKLGERLSFEDAVSWGRQVFEDLLYTDGDGG